MGTKDIDISQYEGESFRFQREHIVVLQLRIRLS